MDKWKKEKLGDIAPIITKGTTPTTNGFNFQKSGIGFVKIENVNNGIVVKSTIEAYISEEAHLAQSRSILKTDDLLFSIAGTIGKIALVKESDLPLNTNQALAIIRGYTNEIIPEFLGYTLVSSLLSETVNKARGGALQNISLTDLKNAEITYPSSKIEQKRIVSKLDTLFKKTDTAIQLLVENLKHSKALISSALDEEFGNLESTYEKRPLAEIVTVINGRAYKQTEMLDSGKYPILRVGNFFSNRGWYYSDMELEDNKYCEKGDLLYAWSASFGPKIWDGEKSIYHYHIWKLVPTSNNVSKKFMYYLLERDTDKIKEEGGRGVGMIHITKGDIEKRMMVLPPLGIQEAVVSRIEKIYDLHEKLTVELKLKLENMNALKSSLLDQAFKGEL
jgi:type I restriction enzyme S subunit